MYVVNWYIECIVNFGQERPALDAIWPPLNCVLHLPFTCTCTYTSTCTYNCTCTYSYALCYMYVLYICVISPTVLVSILRYAFLL